MDAEERLCTQLHIHGSDELFAALHSNRYRVIFLFRIYDELLLIAHYRQHAFQIRIHAQLN